MILEEIEILIIDDEEIWREGLASNLSEFGFNVTGKAASYNEALQLLETISYDLVMVDVTLDNGHSGISLGKLINTKYRKPFIYITAGYKLQNIDDVVASKPSAYILKPVNPFSLVVAIQNAIQNFTTQQTAELIKTDDKTTSFFFVKFGQRYKKIDWSDIVYLRSEQNYTRIFNAADKQEYSVRSTLTKTIQFIIPRHMQASFIQINRAEAIQLSFVTELNGDEIRTPYKTLYVTDAYNKELRKRVTFFT